MWLVRLSSRRTIVGPRLLTALLSPRSLTKASEIVVDTVDSELRVASLGGQQS